LPGGGKKATSPLFRNLVDFRDLAEGPAWLGRIGRPSVNFLSVSEIQIQSIE
jgi:hypothetical protein